MTTFFPGHGLGYDADKGMSANKKAGVCNYNL